MAREDQNKSTSRASTGARAAMEDMRHRMRRATRGAQMMTRSSLFAATALAAAGLAVASLAGPAL
ncbi:MAG TPA: hypothetical protein VNE67_11165, partial [Acetobacteraceae bacterium]|nr:hypothetical protein [Acetobacteraceae bacterium]